MADVDDGYRQLAAGIYLEGLAIDPVRDRVWYSDVIAGGVHGLGSDGSTVTLDPDRMWTGGILVNDDGRILSSGRGGIRWNDPESDASGWLLDAIDGEPVNGINEMVPDGHGGLYFGTVDLDRIVAGEQPRPASLYRLTAAGAVSRVADGLSFANGLALAADGRTLYCNATFDGPYAFDVAPDGTLGERRRLLAKPDCDGMALDAAGDLWLTGFQSGELVRLRPDGTPLTPVSTPAVAITQLRFGGADARDLYLACVPADGGESLKQGRTPTERRSFLYRGRSPTPGRPIGSPRFRIG